jgi:hypothetical protein
LAGGIRRCSTGSALLKLRQRGISLESSACLDIGQPEPGIVNQQKLDALAFQPIALGGSL